MSKKLGRQLFGKGTPLFILNETVRFEADTFRSTWRPRSCNERWGAITGLGEGGGNETGSGSPGSSSRWTVGKSEPEASSASSGGGSWISSKRISR